MTARDARAAHKRGTTAVVSVDRPRSIRDRPAQPAPKADPSRAIGASVLVMLLAGAIAATVYALQSDLFRVHSVKISGASLAVRQHVEDIVAPGCEELSATDTTASVKCPPGLLGANELTLSTRQIERELQAIPEISSAQVQAVMPGKLNVALKERHPEAGWLVGSDVLRVADDGVVMDRGPLDGLKVVVGQVGGTPLKPGDRIDTDVIHGAEQLQTELPASFGIAAKRVQYSPSDGLAVIGDQEMIAMFGPPRDLNVKMAELQRINQLASDKKTPLAFVDLRYKTPYYRTR